MSVSKGSGWAKRLGIGALAVLFLGVGMQPAPAQTRTLANLSDVPAYVPAPYHPHTATASYSAALYDGYPYYGNAYLGFGAHYWH